MCIGARRHAARSPARGEVVARESGQALILWVLAATVILVIAAVVVDVGLWLTERRKAQLAADFAALAAASELRDPAGNPGARAEARALDFAGRNGFVHGSGGVDVEVFTPYEGDPGMVEVRITQNAPLLFSSIFGAAGFDIGARAVGTLGSGEAGPLDFVMILDRTTTMGDPPTSSIMHETRR